MFNVRRLHPSRFGYRRLSEVALMDGMIRSIAIDAEAVNVEWLDPPRENGLMQVHQISIPRGADYEDEIDAVVAATEALLVDVLEDAANMPAWEPDDDEDD